MGQQQLLLLVLSTVIVGLATVAGIQAFSENQAQATQDALVQRAITIANDVKAAHDTPSQLGGVDLTDLGSNGKSKIADAIGISDAGSIPADGAGESASCEITTSPSNLSGQAAVSCTGSGAEIEAVVDVNNGDNPVRTDIISVAS